MLGEAWPALVSQHDLIVNVVAREEAGLRPHPAGRARAASKRRSRAAARSSPATSRSRCTTRTASPSSSPRSWRATRASRWTGPASTPPCASSASVPVRPPSRRGPATRRPTAPCSTTRARPPSSGGAWRTTRRRAGCWPCSSAWATRKAAKQGTVEIFLDRTPFYAEGGGQIGDTGTIVTESGIADVYDTQYAVPGLIVHKARVDGEVVAGQDALATIDGERREAIRRNHTATHLLHSALRTVLGDHVRQQGSLVAPDYLRFDFSHHSQPTREELDEVFALANAAVLTDVRGRDDGDLARRGRRDGRHRLLRRQVRGVGPRRAGRAELARVLRRHARRLARPDRADHACSRRGPSARTPGASSP